MTGEIKDFIKVKEAYLAKIYGGVSGGTVDFQDSINLNGQNIVGGATGTKIGTATSHKIGFHGTAAVVQQAHIANPTDLATCITAITAITALLEAYGLTATS
jgi:hypothetical protein